MRKVWVIAVREYLAAVRTKSFIFSMAFVSLMIGGSVLVQLVLHRYDQAQVKRYAVIDRTGVLYAELEKRLQETKDAAARAAETAPEVTVSQGLPEAKDWGNFVLESVQAESDLQSQRYGLSERVRSGGLTGFLEIGRDVLKPAPAAALAGRDDESEHAVYYRAKIPGLDPFPQWAGRVINQAVREKRLAEDHLSKKKVDAALRPVPVEATSLFEWDAAAGKPRKGTKTAQLASFLVPAGLMVLMFMMVIVVTTPLMQGVLDEKANRIAEVLLGSVGPFQLMLGKLIGMVGVGLTVLVVYLGALYWAAHRYGFTANLPGDLLAWFLAFQVLAVVMYGSIFIAVGAACTDSKEAQSMVLPVTLVACLPLLATRFVIQEPHSPLVTGLSFFPLATPMVMVARQAVPPGLPWWQPVSGIAVVLVTTLVFVYAAGRIFRVGILLQGKGARLGEMMRWVFRG